MGKQNENEDEDDFVHEEDCWCACCAMSDLMDRMDEACRRAGEKPFWASE